MANKSITDLEQEYKNYIDILKNAASEISRQISALPELKTIKLAIPLQFRAKEWSSISEKIQQGKFTPKKSILEMQDLVGIRFILLFLRDIEPVVNLVHSTFLVKREYNTEDKLADDQFGYQSKHLIVELKDEWFNVPTLNMFKNIQFEIQIRTLAQHSWAEGSNFFQYKNKEGIPKELRRTISRISALLETVDLEYGRLLDDREKYQNEINSQNIDDQELNVDLLMRILSDKLPAKHKSSNEDYSYLLTQLTTLNLNTVNNIDDLVTNYLEKALIEDRVLANGYLSKFKLESQLYKEDHQYDPEEYARAKEGVFYTHTGLIRTMLNHKFKKPFWEEINNRANTSQNEAPNQ